MIITSNRLFTLSEITAKELEVLRFGLDGLKKGDFNVDRKPGVLEIAKNISKEINEYIVSSNIKQGE